MISLLVLFIIFIAIYFSINEKSHYLKCLANLILISCCIINYLGSVSELSKILNLVAAGLWSTTFLANLYFAGVESSKNER